MEEIFLKSSALYKLYFRNEESEFTLFSPEIFINVIRDRIFTYPIKGTLATTIPNAKETLLNDEKESCRTINYLSGEKWSH